MMKIQKIILLSGAVCTLPALLTACSAKKEEIQAQPVVVPVKAEVKPEPKTEPKFIESKEEVKPAVKEEVKPVVKEEVKPVVKEEVKATLPAIEKKISVKATLPCKHTVVTGDNLWKISARYYGKGSLWKKILNANKSVIKKESHLEPGTVLEIPAE